MEGVRKSGIGFDPAHLIGWPRSWFPQKSGPWDHGGQVIVFDRVFEVAFRRSGYCRVRKTLRTPTSSAGKVCPLYRAIVPFFRQVYRQKKVVHCCGMRSAGQIETDDASGRRFRVRTCRKKQLSRPEDHDRSGRLPKSEVLTTLAGANALSFLCPWIEGLPLTQH